MLALARRRFYSETDGGTFEELGAGAKALRIAAARRDLKEAYPEVRSQIDQEWEERLEKERSRREEAERLLQSETKRLRAHLKHEQEQGWKPLRDRAEKAEERLREVERQRDNAEAQVRLLRERSGPQAVEAALAEIKAGLNGEIGQLVEEGHNEAADRLRRLSDGALSSTPLQQDPEEYAVGDLLDHPCAGRWKLIEHIGGEQDDWRGECVIANFSNEEVGRTKVFHREYMERTFRRVPDLGPLACGSCDGNDPECPVCHGLADRSTSLTQPEADPEVPRCSLRDLRNLLLLAKGKGAAATDCNGTGKQPPAEPQKKCSCDYDGVFLCHSLPPERCQKGWPPAEPQGDASTVAPEQVDATSKASTCEPLEVRERLEGLERFTGAHIAAEERDGTYVEVDAVLAALDKEDSDD